MFEFPGTLPLRFGGGGYPPILNPGWVGVDNPNITSSSPSHSSHPRTPAGSPPSARFGFDLQLLPVILGFLCFRLAGGVVAVQDLLRSARGPAPRAHPWLPG